MKRFFSKFRRYLSFFFCIAMMFLLCLKTNATHISGADITYRWVSGNTFEVRLTLYRDCSGIPAPNNPIITYSSASCGYDLTTTLSQVPGSVQEIGQNCSTLITTCNGGSNPGIQRYEYKGLVSLPAQCTDWKFGYSICCRNCAITSLFYRPNNCNNLPGTYVEATLNNIAAPQNSAPFFTNYPLAFLCLGQTFNYNNAALDVNGDSIVYSFVTPRDENTNNVVYNTGYSASSPIASNPPMSITPNTGQISITPTTQEVTVMAILVQEYRNGALVGSVVRDMQIWTQPCNNNLPTASGINGTNNYSITACPGQPLTFTINSSDANSNQAVTMNWNNSISEATFTAGTGSRPTGRFSWTPTAADARSQPYIFTITVQDNFCPINGFQTFSYSIFVPPITAVATSTNTLCALPVTGTASVTATGHSPFTYRWSPTGATTPSIFNLLPGTYTVTVTNASGCTATSAVTVIGPAPLALNLSTRSNVTCAGMNNGAASISVSGGTAPYHYRWSTGSESSTISNLSAGNYSVVTTDANGCSAVSSFTLFQPPALITRITGNQQLCVNQQGFLNASASGGTPPYTYNWNNVSGGSTLPIVLQQTQTFTLTVIDANGCVAAPISETVQIAPPLMAVTNMLDSICRGEQSVLSVFASGGDGGPYKYLWNTGATTSSISVTPNSTTSYTVSVSDGCGSTPTSAIVDVVVSTPPVLNINLSNDEGCNPLSVSFNSNYNSAIEYSWFFGDGEISSDPSPVHVYNNPGIFNVTCQLIGDHNCISRVELPTAVSVYDNPNARIVQSDEETTIMQPFVQFLDMSTGGSERYWDLGDGTTSSQHRISHTYRDTGLYKIRLISLNQHGCTDTTYSRVYVKGEYAIYIPDAFSPNNDGINETFKPVGVGIMESELMIFDKWGILIFSTHNTEKGWDGTIDDNGTLCQNDVYVYKLITKDLKGDRHSYIGHVTLVR